MKKITLLLFVLSSTFSFSQVVLDEDFEAGLSLPTGWTNNDIAGGGDIWAFANGADAIGFTAGNGYNYDLAEMEGNYAVFDSDGKGDNSIAENAALESPLFDCSSLTTVELSFNHFFTSGFGGQGFVEVSTNGTTWVQVANYTGADAGASSFGLESINVTTQLAGISTAQVRFRWVGDFAWGWAFDNVSVFQCTVNTPDAVTSAISPTNGATDVSINYGSLNNLGPFEWIAPATGDPASSFTINLGTNLAGDNIGAITSFSSGDSINFDWQPNTTYYWFIEAVNCAGSTPGTVFSFTTAACSETSAPIAASAPIPADGATNVSLTSPDFGLAFNWTEGSGSESFTLNFGTTFTTDQSFEGFANGDALIGLSENTTYYWTITAINCFGTITSPIWSFTTGTALSIEEEKLDILSIFPNPASDEITIKTSVKIDQIDVFNLIGQNVNSLHSEQIINNKIDVSSLKTGIYIMKVKSEERVQSIRFIKE